MKKLTIFFSAGSFGGLINSLSVWLFGYLGINHSFHVSIAPTLSPAWLYPRIVWGGIWGALFFLIKDKKKLNYINAFWISLGPSFVQLLWVFPFKAGKGYFGLELGILTPIMVLLFNYIWALSACFIVKGTLIKN